MIEKWPLVFNLTYLLFHRVCYSTESLLTVIELRLYVSSISHVNVIIIDDALCDLIG